jgi:hypothetical protein
MLLHDFMKIFSLLKKSGNLTITPQTVDKVSDF